jgi:hypothetical protein
MGIERDEGTRLPIEPHVLKPPAVENAVDDQVEALDARPPAGRSLTRAKPPARSSERSYHPTRDPKPLGKIFGDLIERVRFARTLRWRGTDSNFRFP